MAEIDKVLPNVEQTINVPNPQDVEIAEQEKLAEQGQEEDRSGRKVPFYLLSRQLYA